MNVERFAAERADDWAALEALVDRAKGRADRLPPPEVLRLGLLYRSAAADLAVARRRFPGAPGTVRLERLVARAHGLVYGTAIRNDAVRRFVTTRLWQRVRSEGRCLALSAGVLVGFTLLGALWAAARPEQAVGLLPAGFHASAHPGQGGAVDISIPARSGLAVQIFVNNILVSFEVLVGGFTLGLLTVYILATNGAMLGALGVLELKAGGFSQFVRLVVPHGLLELSCIVVSGGAGFAVARALIDPGHRTRAEALRRLTPALGDLVLGVAGCLVVAGITEGVVTTWDLPLAAALTVGLILAGTFWGSVAWRGRSGPDPPANGHLEPTARPEHTAALEHITAPEHTGATGVTAAPGAST